MFSYSIFYNENLQIKNVKIKLILHPIGTRILEVGHGQSIIFGWINIKCGYKYIYLVVWIMVEMHVRPDCRTPFKSQNILNSHVGLHLSALFSLSRVTTLFPSLWGWVSISSNIKVWTLTFSNYQIMEKSKKMLMSISQFYYFMDKCNFFLFNNYYFFIFYKWINAKLILVV